MVNRLPSPKIVLKEDPFQPIHLHILQITSQFITIMFCRILHHAKLH